MSQHIPRCRHWRVTYWQGNRATHTVVILTINKRFARWLARDVVGHLVAYHAERITVSLAK